MKKLLLPSIIAMLALPVFADSETPAYVTNSSNCNQGVLQTDTGPAALEANYSANTINTTWYSDGTALSGNDVPSSCTYDAALVPPTPDARPGYTFGGWTVKAAPILVCQVPDSDVNNNGEEDNKACLDLNGAGECAGKMRFDLNAPNYGITEPGEWGVTWSNGDKVTGVALCSTTGNGVGGQFFTGNPDTSNVGTYCWCKATHYTAYNAQKCALSAPWVFVMNSNDESECLNTCASRCDNGVTESPAMRGALFERIDITE